MILEETGMGYIMQEDDEAMAKVSIIMPVYNEEQYLEQCLDSICGQTFKETEIICVDDGSTDATPEILNNYAKRDHRIKIITQQNRFAGAARNRGMECASGKYLFFLDADDYYENDMVEKMVRRAEEKQADIVICRYAQTCEEDILQNGWEFEDLFFQEEGQKEAFAGGDLNCAGIFQITKGWAWDKLFRAEFVRSCGYEFPEFRSSEDGFFVYMLLARAKRISYMDDILAVHRIAVQNALSNTKEENWQNGFRMWSMIANELKKMNLYEVYEQSFINELIYFLFWYLESMKSFEAFRDCYDYIQNEVEKEFRMLSYGKDFFFQGDLWAWYKEVREISVAEYLFRRRR